MLIGVTLIKDFNRFFSSLRPMYFGNFPVFMLQNLEMMKVCRSFT